MERFIRKFWSLMLVGIVVMGTSCTKNGEELGDGDEEIVTVALSLGGELRETQTPMMSANRVGEENNDLYGIQIKVGNILWDGYYAWGIFDDLTGVTVDLAPSKTYSIIVTYIPDGKNLVYNYGDDTNVCYDIPFNTFGWSETTMNKFNYTSSEYLYALNPTCGTKFPPEPHLLSATTCEGFISPSFMISSILLLAFNIKLLVFFVLLDVT